MFIYRARTTRRCPNGFVLPPAVHLLFYYLIVRTALWTLLLYFTQPSPPLDVVEHLAWGREWLLVYAHHPGLPAWLNEIFYSVGGVFALSLLSPLCTAAAIGAAYYTARLFVVPRLALVIALSLEGVLYFNVLAVEFNHNILQLATCAWLVGIVGRLFLRPAKTRVNPRELLGWGVLGIVAAVTMFAKYSSLLFLVPLFVWSVAAPAARLHWKTLGPWVALVVFLGFNIPQLLALVELRFAPMQFALSRANDADRWADYLLYPLRFFGAQVGAFALAGILCIVALKNNKKENAKKENVTSPDEMQRQFLFVAAFGALLLALFISLIFGLRLRSMWGAAMLTFIPLWVFVSFPRPLNWRRWFVAFTVVTLLAPFAAVVIQVGGPFIKGRGKRIHYPGAAIAAKAEDLWQKAHPSAPLCYVVGAKHIASLTALYARPRLSTVIDGNWEKSFWTTRDQFRDFGGIIVWAADDGRRKSSPPAYAAELANAAGESEAGEVYNFRWQTAANLPPLKIGFIIVAPQKTSTKCSH